MSIKKYLIKSLEEDSSEILGVEATGWAEKLSQGKRTQINNN